MSDPASPRLPLRDTGQRFVQRSALALFAFSTLLTAGAALWHRWAPAQAAIHQVAPPLLALAFGLLTLRQWRQPQRLAENLWAGWAAWLIGMALPTWWLAIWAERSGQPLLDHLPPVGAVFLPTLMIMALFATPRQALWATLLSWLAVAAPVIAYLLRHAELLATARGLELLVALGPVALIVPLLLPLLRGLEQRFESLHMEGERLQALAERDVLIGLYNRRAGERFLSTLLAHSREDAALILFDIDHFKRINDGHGHPAGDAVLIEVGQRCNAALRETDVLARWGGEEFLVILPGEPPQAAHEVAERLRQVIADAPIAPVGAVTASFGVTVVRPEDTLAEVVQRADEALYQAKAAGRNRVVEV